MNKYEQKDNQTKEEISKLEKKMEVYITKTEAREKSNDAKFSNLKKLVEESKNTFKCDQCVYVGLKTYSTKKHNKKGIIKSFPQKCTLCDKVLKAIKKYK